MADFRYSIDTSALLHGFTRIMPPDVVPRLWEEKLDEIVENGTLLAAYDVLEDLGKRDDGVFKWANDRKTMFVELDQFEPQLKTIMKDYPRLVDTKKNKSGSDPMVIALAMAKGLTVVSEEGMGSETSPRIQYVCNALDIRHINFLALVREQKWVF